MIKLFRVDSRLIHGQIVEGWLKAYPVDEILVIDDDIYNSEFETRVMRFSVPQEVSFEILTIGMASERWPTLEASAKKILVIVQSIEILKKLFDMGVTLPGINMGLVNYTDSKTALTKSVYIDETEKEILFCLLEKGVKIFIQTLPSDEKIPLEKIIGMVGDGSRKDPAPST
ncbi:MAG: PTS sugar transporter subunit IIB [bacterium]